MNITDAMHEGVEWVGPILRPSRSQRMRDKDVGAIPVGKKDRLVGMITDRDLAMRVVAEGKMARRLRPRTS